MSRRCTAAGASRPVALALGALALAGTTGCAAAGRIATAAGEAIARVPASSADLPRTRAERSAYRQTSTHADVIEFLEALQEAGLPVALGVLGRSSTGREIPYAVASRPVVRTPADARRLGRPVVYVQGNIHGGEVEGKDAVLALLRDVLAERSPGVLDSIVFVAVPIYNVDGNDRLGPQERNRGEQNGPDQVGERANGQGLDLNRDYIKAEAPETRASLAAFAAWDPDIFVDLHTTNGSFHGYALTYAPPLAPVGDAAAYTRDSLLPVLRERMRARHGMATFDYGNFDGTYSEPGADTITRSWKTYDHRPRFGVNYVGLRGRVAILSEAYSHDPFERRVRATYTFVREILSLTAERATQLSRLAAASASGPAAGAPIAIRSRLTTSPRQAGILAEEVVATGDSARTEPGVRRGRRRSGRFRMLDLALYDRFEPSLAVAAPTAYAIDPGQEDVIRMLRLHGIALESLIGPTTVAGEVFDVDSTTRATRVFQGHRETRAFGRWHTVRRSLAAGTLIVPVAQASGALAAYLLEPESDDGLVTWNVLDSSLRPGAEFPVLRVTRVLGAPRRAHSTEP